MHLSYALILHFRENIFCRYNSEIFFTFYLDIIARVLSFEDFISWLQIISEFL